MLRRFGTEGDKVDCSVKCNTSEFLSVLQT